MPRLYQMNGIGLLLVGLLAAGGCSEEIALAPPSDRPFTFYGTLNPTADTQWVFVWPISPRLAPVQVTPPDARVTSTDAVTGETIPWNYMVTKDQRGNNLHTYRAVFRPVNGREYEVRIERSDGVASHAATRIPPAGALRIEEAIYGASIWTPVIIETAARYLLRVDVIYDVTVETAGEPPLRRRVTIPYVSPSRTASGWRVPIDLPQDRFRIHSSFIDPDLPLSISLHAMEFRAVVANEEWYPPEGDFNPEVLVDPNIMTNVRNGYGFLTSGYALSRVWLPPAEFLANSGFIVLPDSTRL